MPKQDLNDPDVGPALQKMSGKTVPERVGRDGLADPRLSPGNPAGGLQGPGADRRAGFLAWKQPQSGPRPPPISAKNAQQARRQHRITVSAAFAVLDVDQHPRAVDRGDLQARNPRAPRARRIIPTRVKADSFQGFQNGASSESCPSASATGPMHDA